MGLLIRFSFILGWMWLLSYRYECDTQLYKIFEDIKHHLWSQFFLLSLISDKKTDRYYYKYYQWTERCYEWTDEYYKLTDECNEWTDEYYEWADEYYEWKNEYYDWEKSTASDQASNTIT